GEQCEDGNNVNIDGCVNSNPAACGDGNVWAGHEACDDGNNVNTDGCVNCNPAACGDGNVWAGHEACDDGNNVDGDGCSHGCEIEIPPGCGDGTKDAGEQCDDGNNINGDGCSAGCTNEVDLCAGNTCNDGLVCNGIETCNPVNGACVPGAPLNCPDDGNVCTGTEFCNNNNNKGCDTKDVPADCCDSDEDCNDEDVCTTDTCNKENGKCKNDPITGCCKDDSECSLETLFEQGCMEASCDLNTNTCDKIKKPYTYTSTTEELGCSCSDSNGNPTIGPLNIPIQNPFTNIENNPQKNSKNIEIDPRMKERLGYIKSVQEQSKKLEKKSLGENVMEIVENTVEIIQNAIDSLKYVGGGNEPTLDIGGIFGKYKSGDKIMIPLKDKTRLEVTLMLENDKGTLNDNIYFIDSNNHKYIPYIEEDGSGRVLFDPDSDSYDEDITYEFSYTKDIITPSSDKFERTTSTSLGGDCIECPEGTVWDSTLKICFACEDACSKVDDTGPVKKCKPVCEAESCTQCIDPTNGKCSEPPKAEECEECDGGTVTDICDEDQCMECNGGDPKSRCDEENGEICDGKGNCIEMCPDPCETFELTDSDRPELGGFCNPHGVCSESDLADCKQCVVDEVTGEASCESKCKTPCEECDGGSCVNVPGAECKLVTCEDKKEITDTSDEQYVIDETTGETNACETKVSYKITPMPCEECKSQQSAEA
ncbi:MAG: DUF4215 domain-containing protein, partial [Candidatus Nanoarchaeia archaeon]|nr:DUF4215 domain-containing protein [Candidatus Nanoarchaeia archaeon]